MTDRTRHIEMREHFAEFHAKHPEVYARFTQLAFERINKGFKHYGAQAILALIRWETPLGADGKTAFKINDHFAAFYSRIFAENFPQHAGFFKRRKLASRAKAATNRPPLGPEDFEEDDE